MKKYIFTGVASASAVFLSCSKETPQPQQTSSASVTHMQVGVNLVQPEWEEAGEGVRDLRFDGSDEGFPLLSLSSEEFDATPYIADRSDRRRFDKTSFRVVLRRQSSDGSITGSSGANILHKDNSGNTITIMGTPGHQSLKITYDIPTINVFQDGGNNQVYTSFVIGGIAEVPATTNALTLGKQYFSDMATGKKLQRRMTAPNQVLGPMKKGVYTYRNFPITSDFIKITETEGSGSSILGTGYGNLKMRGSLLALKLVNATGEPITLTYLRPDWAHDRPLEYEGYFHSLAEGRVSQGTTIPFYPSYSSSSNWTTTLPDVTTYRENLKYPIYTAENALQALAYSNNRGADLLATEILDGEKVLTYPRRGIIGLPLSTEEATDGRILFWGMPRKRTSMPALTLGDQTTLATQDFNTTPFRFKVEYKNQSGVSTLSGLIEVQAPSGGFQEGKCYTITAKIMTPEQTTTHQRNKQNN